MAETGLADNRFPLAPTRARDDGARHDARWAVTAYSGRAFIFFQAGFAGRQENTGNVGEPERLKRPLLLLFYYSTGFADSGN